MRILELCHSPYPTLATGNKSQNTWVKDWEKMMICNNHTGPDSNQNSIVDCFISRDHLPVKQCGRDFDVIVLGLSVDAVSVDHAIIFDFSANKFGIWCPAFCLPGWPLSARTQIPPLCLYWQTLILSRALTPTIYTYINTDLTKKTRTHRCILCVAIHDLKCNTHNTQWPVSVLAEWKQCCHCTY